eukprot:Gb_36848 [translate_table: standard]
MSLKIVFPSEERLNCVNSRAFTTNKPVSSAQIDINIEQKKQHPSRVYYLQVKKYLQPLQGLLEGKENNVNNSEIHGPAKCKRHFRNGVLKCLLPKNYSNALRPCLEVTASVRMKKEKEKPKEGVNLFGEQAEGPSTGLVVLVVGLVTDLVICTGESKPRDADAFSEVVSLVEQLEPWLRGKRLNLGKLRCPGTRKLPVDGIWEYIVCNGEDPSPLMLQPVSVQP